MLVPVQVGGHSGRRVRWRTSVRWCMLVPMMKMMKSTADEQGRQGYVGA
jgi:hypothetical protein